MVQFRYVSLFLCVFKRGLDVVFNIASTLLQMSSGEISEHEGKLMCYNAEGSWEGGGA